MAAPTWWLEHTPPAAGGKDIFGQMCSTLRYNVITATVVAEECETVSRVMSIRFGDEQVQRLGRLSRRLGKRPSETVTLLVEEALRMAEHPGIDFRDSPAGRHAYVKGSGLAVWEVAMVARDYGGDAAAVATHLQWPLTRVQAALNYARDYQGEIETALADNDAVDVDALRRLLPQTQRFDVSAEATHERP